MSGVRTRMVPASLVPVSREIIQQAMDQLTVTKGRSVTLMFFNGMCLGVDTGEPLQLPSPVNVVVKDANEPRRRHTMHSLTEDLIYEMFASRQSPLSARTINDELGLETHPMRQRVSRIIRDLQKTGRLIRESGTRMVYTVSGADHGVRPDKSLADGVKLRNKPRSLITVDKIFAILQEEPAISKTIGDKLGLPRASPTRSKITELISIAIKGGRVEIAGQQDGARLYRLVAEQSVAA